MASDLERAWYDADEGGITSRMYDGEDYDAREEDRLKAKEAKYKQDQAKLGVLPSNRINPYKRMRNVDQEAWEANRLGAVGLNDQGDRNLNFDADDDDKVIVMVRNTIPPFLDGRTMYTQQADGVSVVKDPTSDIAVLAKEGSEVVRRMKMDQDKSKMKDRFWEVAGSKIGNAIGIVSKSSEESKSAYAPDVLKQQFGQLMTGDNITILDDKIEQTRRSLPIFQCKSELMRIVRDHQIIVIVGETGSGKTTQLTQYLFEGGFAKSGLIGCTQPRRVAAVSVAKRVSEEMGVPLGQTVGYTIRFEDCTSSSTKIKYMTDGVLLREALNDFELEKYSVVIMDEAHERSMNTDILFGVLKRVVSERSDFKLIVTSATMDSAKFSKFFKHAPVYIIPGRTFPVETFFSKVNTKDYVESAVDQAVSVHVTQQNEPGDILIFMTGQDDIETTCILLADRIDRLINDTSVEMPPLTILPIYSQLPQDLQAKIFEPSVHRKVIIATNIAETSLTVDGVRFVIDCGFAKLKVFNPKIGMDTLHITPISRANANQRSGRAGRTGPGICWRLYTEHVFFYELLDSQIPEIQRTNLSNVVLLLKSLGVKNLLEFDFMDPPPQATILASMHQLWLLQALDDFGELTVMGAKMGQFPLDPALSKMILMGDLFGCVMEMVIIVSMLTVPSIFFRPKDRSEESDGAREKFFVPESDHLTLLNVFQQYMHNGSSPQWCLRHFVHFKSLKKVEEIRQQILDIMKIQKIPESSVGIGGDWDIVRKAVVCSYFHNVGKLRGIGEYVNLLTSIPCCLHPTSALYGLGHTPEYIVYHEVIKTTKEYMQCVTAVTPEWLEEIGGKFFYLRYSHMDAVRERERDKRITAHTHETTPIETTTTQTVTNVLVANPGQLLVVRKKVAIVASRSITPPNPEDSDNEQLLQQQRRLKNKKIPSKIQTPESFIES